MRIGGVSGGGPLQEAGGVEDRADGAAGASQAGRGAAGGSRAAGGGGRMEVLSRMTSSGAAEQAAGAADDVFTRAARSPATRSDLVKFIMDFRTDVRDYYEPGDERQHRADKAAAKAFFEGARPKPVRVPAGFTAHKALKLEGRDPKDVIEGDVILLFDRRGKVVDALLQVKEGRRTETYKMSDL